MSFAQQKPSIQGLTKMNDAELKLKQEFIDNTPKGTAFAFGPAKTGEHLEDGTVFFDSEGWTLRYFKNIDDFADYWFLDKEVPHKESDYVGNRNEEGVITWHDKPYDLKDIDKGEDGSNVYTKPVDVPY
jgi:hypothetical protein